MINELYKLSVALDDAGINVQEWHRKLAPIPNISAKAPCVRIEISEGKVTSLSKVDKEQGKDLRKYGTKQGSYPCMNLAALYRVTDDGIKKELSDLCEHPETLDADKIEEIRGWCRENNWARKFRNKYKISMMNTTEELAEIAAEYEPLRALIEESSRFSNPDDLHRALEDAAFGMLETGEDIALALYVLFYQGKAEEANDFGSISAALDSPRLRELGTPAVSRRFAEGLNEALLSAETLDKSEAGTSSVDAFGNSLEPVGEPMPAVKLAGGIEVTLRTMFKEQRCQTRYGRIEDRSYPISKPMRKRLQASLNWLGSSERKGRTWVNTGKDEILFAYPAQLPEVPISFTDMFKPAENGEMTFEQQAGKFISELRRTKREGSDSSADGIQIFILRKMDKARTKVVYTRQTDPYELERCCEEWTLGCKNLPVFFFGEPDVPFPLSTVDTLNHFWMQNGETAADNFNPTPKYHGMELLMEPGLSVAADLHILVEKTSTIAKFLGNRLANRDFNHKIWDEIKKLLAVTGLVLYRRGIRKDDYMENFPYLYGQLLKVSDELHALYCAVMRDGSIPTQLAGSGAYRGASEAPARTFGLLGQRMNPYITWARSYRTKNVHEKGKESWRAGWLLSMYEKTADKIDNVWQPGSRMNDAEKAQLFIGYLASLPKEERGIQAEENQEGKE